MLGVVGITSAVLARDHRSVLAALPSDAALNDGPEIAVSVRVKGAALAWLEPNLPHADRRILEPQLRPDVEVLRRSLQLLGVVVRIEGLLGDHSGGHAVLLGLWFSWTGAVECWF